MDTVDLAQYKVKTGRNAGRLASYAWPGGYPLFYLCEDGCILCPDCATENADPTEPQWNVVAVDVNWEDPSLNCDHCDRRIESAYAEEE